VIPRSDGGFMAKALWRNGFKANRQFSSNFIWKYGRLFDNAMFAPQASLQRASGRFGWCRSGLIS
jgi:hypothetical protein